MSTRLLQDKGRRAAAIGLTLLVAIGVIDTSRRNNERNRQREHPALDVRAICRDRNAKGAIGTLRPLLENAPALVGKSYSTAEAPITGMLHLEIPHPTPPRFSAELQIGSEDCVTTRIEARADEPERTIELRPTKTATLPVDLADPPVSTGFPPPATEQHVAKLRSLRTGTEGVQLFDGPTPSCAQCHVSTGEEHARGHGKAVSPSVMALVKTAGQVDALECVRCHAPVHAAANPELRAPMTTETGFSCSACHRYKALKEAQGNGLGVGGVFVAADDLRAFARGGRPDTASPVMAVEFTREAGAVCFACHGQTRGPVVVDTTLEEHAVWQKSHPEATCQGCHFPTTQDPFLVDGYARWMWGVERTKAPRKSHVSSRNPGDSVRLDGKWEGDVLVVEAENIGASHALPGVKPWQAWKIEIVTTEKTVDGQPLEVVLARFLVDEKGDACALPWEATGVRADSRLLPQTPVRWTWRFSRRHPLTVRLSESTRCAERANALNVPLVSRVYKDVAVPP